MVVRDVRRRATRICHVVNLDATGGTSQAVANRHCAMYGVPAANQFKFNFGTGKLWAHSGDRINSFWIPLATHLRSIGADAVYSTAGCPVGIESLDQDGNKGQNGDGLNFALMLGFAKRIADSGYEPRLAVSGGFYPMKGPGYNDYLYDPAFGTNHKGAQVTDAAAIANLVQLATDPIHQAAGATAIDAFKFTTLRDSEPDFSQADNLVTGHVGYYTQSESTHPSGLDTLSYPILGKAGNLAAPFAYQAGRKVLCCPQTLTGSNYCHDSSQALIGKKLKDLGLDVSHWYASAPSAVAEALLPAAGALGWDATALDNNTTSPASITYQYAVGCGFANSKQTTWGGAAKPMRASTSGGVMSVGQSYGDNWGKQAMVDGGFSYIQHMQTEEYGWHQTALQQGKLVDIWLNLLAGRSLAEAAWCALEFTFLAVGDPELRPFA